MRLTQEVADAVRDALRYLPSNASHDATRKALGNALASFDRDVAHDNDIQAVNEHRVHVFLGGEHDAGASPETVAFATADEATAFITGLSKMDGNDGYTLVASEDYRIDSEGEPRLFPPNVDSELPLIRMHMTTADGCEKTLVYGIELDTTLNASAVQLEAGSWSPDEPELETLTVEIEICDSDGSELEELTGDQFRDLESSGALESYLGALGNQNPDRAATILSEAEGSLGMRP